MGKKQEVLAELFRQCQERGEWVFDNELVKRVCDEFQFKNPFDVTKIDNSALFPEIMKQGEGYFVIHLGGGYHQFIPKIRLGYHQIEEIDAFESESWTYKPSLLNEYDSSESNIISVGYNQRILHHFLYGDIVADPKLYLSQRTKITTTYTIDSQPITVNKLQMEMDAVLELGHCITIIEGKNGYPRDFATYQLFHPYLYFDGLRRENRLDIRGIQCCYLQRRKEDGQSTLRLHLYRFCERELSSIKLIRKAEYSLGIRGAI